MLICPKDDDYRECEHYHKKRPLGSRCEIDSKFSSCTMRQGQSKTEDDPYYSNLIQDTKKGIKDSKIERLKEINLFVVDFCEIETYYGKSYPKKGKYKEFLKKHPELVSEAKRIIVDFQQSNHVLICCIEYCNYNKRIWGNGILHHFHYDWLNLYNFNDCGIICKECNDKYKTHEGLILIKSN